LALIALARGWISLYWLLRCTVPQLSVAELKVLVPFIAFCFIFVNVSITVVLLFVNGEFLKSTHNSPPAAAKKEKRIFGGHPRTPGKGLLPSALLLSEWMSVEQRRYFPCLEREEKQR
jgi:hypothetical protein